MRAQGPCSSSLTTCRHQCSALWYGHSEQLAGGGEGKPATLTYTLVPQMVRKPVVGVKGSWELCWGACKSKEVWKSLVKLKVHVLLEMARSLVVRCWFKFLLFMIHKGWSWASHSLEEYYHLWEQQHCSGMGLPASCFVISFLQVLDLSWYGKRKRRRRKKRRKRKGNEFVVV